MNDEYSRRSSSQSTRYRLIASIIALVLLIANTSSFTSASGQDSFFQDSTITDLAQKFTTFPWVAYAPTHFDPEAGVMPSEADITIDLQQLYDFGFRGIVTYGSNDVFAQIPRLARDVGFEGVIMGIWTPGDPAETQAALDAVDDVDGYVVGNEGLYFDRYEMTVLQAAIDDLKQQTGKPVTTTEVLPLYAADEDESVLNVGDWLFPNVHPFWANVTDPIEAVAWTQMQFERMTEQAGERPVMFKEVGLPTGGAAGTSELRQAEYYFRLSQSPVAFVYFEAFDQPWKREGEGENEGVGAHWGIFNSDGSAKAGTASILGAAPPPLFVYSDALSSDNRFYPAGWMGCSQNITMVENYTEDVASGSTAIELTFSPWGCDQHWAGIYWWTPASCNWYEAPCGIDLNGWTQLKFMARGEEGGEFVEFKVGGLCNATQTTCDTLTTPETTPPLRLTTEWTEYTIDLSHADLSALAGGFAWVTNDNKDITIYLDDIRFE